MLGKQWSSLVIAGALLAACGGENGLVKNLPIEVGDAVVHHKINYVELKATDLSAMKSFYGSVFGWTFQDWGPDYVSFEGAGIDGGFERVDSQPSGTGALVIIFSEDLDKSYEAIQAAGAEIATPPFDFPGGSRFHFRDPAGNELAVWTTREEGQS